MVDNELMGEEVLEGAADLQEEEVIEDNQEEVIEEEVIEEEEAESNTELVEEDKEADTPKYYKSQEEVDKAISHRLNAERRKIEKQYEEDLKLSKALKKLYGDMPPTEILSALEEKEIELLADEMNLSYEAAKRFYQLEQKANAPQQQTADQEYYQSLLQEEAELKKEYPDIDIVELAKNDKAFANMLAVGVPLRDAYMVRNFDKIQKQIASNTERQVVERIKTRNIRPTETTKPKAQEIQFDISKMSIAELDELERRAMNGEKIKL